VKPLKVCCYGKKRKRGKETKNGVRNKERKKERSQNPEEVSFVSFEKSGVSGV
jgi:hypothetical protein